MKLDHVNNLLYEVEIAEAQIELKEPKFVGFFILQYAKLRMPELYYNFFTKFGDVNNFTGLGIDTDSLNLALAEKELEDCIQPDMKTEHIRMRSRDCSDSFTADPFGNFFPRICCDKHKSMTSESLGFSKKNSCIQRCYVYVARRTGDKI